MRETLGMPDVLRDVRVPCLLLVGTDDEAYPYAEEASRTLDSVEFVPLPGLDHVESFYRTDVVLPHVRRFLAEVGEG
jgi:pimeloyl-ACP methyl ester carboxylesterase